MFIRSLLLLSLLAPAAAAAKKPLYVEGEVLVRYRPAASEALIRRHLAGFGAVRMRKLEMPRHSKQGPTVQIKLPAGENVESALRRLSRDPDVEAVQPNYIYRTTATTPNDTLYSSLWGLNNTGQTITAGTLGPDSPSSTHNPGTSGKDMGLPTAWDQITSCGSVVVAVVDTGIKYDHADLAANMWNGGAGAPNHGWDALNNDNDPMDDNGHGTHVAGTIGAAGNNGAGSVGVCWSVQLMAVKTLGADGSGTTAAVASGVNWAVNNGAKVINMSLGSPSGDATLNAALEAAKTAGVIVVVAAGNDGTNNDSTPVYPCNYKKANMICVAALDQAYSLASFSNYGVNTVDVGAPGVNIVSAWPFAFTRTADDFSAGWTYSGSGSGWGPITVSGSPALAVPNNWDYNVNMYVNNADERVYKDFAFGAFDQILLEFDILHNTTTSAADKVSLYYKAGGGDPMGGGTLLEAFTGKTNGYAYAQSYDITACANTTCSVGYQLVSDASGVDTGAVVLNFDLLKLTSSTTAYNVIAGTSMATPHVAGLVAMVIAYQPNYTYTEVINAVKYGGTSVSALSGKTRTGKAVDAPGALSYIAAPQSVTLQLQ